MVGDGGATDVELRMYVFSMDNGRPEIDEDMELDPRERGMCTDEPGSEEYIVPIGPYGRPEIDEDVELDPRERGIYIEEPGL